MNKKLLVGAAVFFAVIVFTVVWGMTLQKQESATKLREVQAGTGTIRETVSTTGVVEPRNRLKIQSSVAGRIEEVLVDEGALVTKGDRLALLSSTERAALLDAARLRDEKEQAYWDSVYSKAVILAPIEGQVIVRSIEPGQTVTTSDSLFVLSDRLIVTAYVDETDIGRVSQGQEATITLDAYPDIAVRGKVEHIHYESHLENNVTIYHVDIIPETIPKVFRSGMSANIDIVVDEREGAVLIPAGAVQNLDGQSVVMVKNRQGDAQGTYVKVTTGLQDEDLIEIREGIEAGTTLLVHDDSFVLPENSGSGNPFLPQRKRR
ncbi:HlyD family efflux transporter periplasmic adaptor subunit [Prosthecochloris sp. SCSIO W1101]|uniref:efflux RND transporter periplasmic adaptor subunit n=1 Tax=Prosthecochloris sp. SCSIO W1101 TaxID=2992242 RepID=UPI00223DD460|nr:HlyD family efflux transporter periplasmic adaptor subunit [Prosthecochloris sp. SCSIO W1101]UZJ42604.1 HlyD family efflux transporter periplasmic adaptor subunit [Prosthecochloris sp. SCSIO W1101]